MKIALIAHDKKKNEIIELAKKYKDALAQYELYATGTTGTLIMGETGLKIERMKSGPKGGDQQIGAMLAVGELDLIIFLRDPLTGLPVIVISRRAAARLTPLPPEGSLLPGMRLMRVRTVAGTSLMPILRPDSLRIRVGGAWQEAEALIGLSPGGGEGFQALVPASLVSTAAPIPVKALSQQTGG